MYLNLNYLEYIIEIRIGFQSREAGFILVNIRRIGFVAMLTEFPNNPAGGIGMDPDSDPEFMPETPDVSPVVSDLGSSDEADSCYYSHDVSENELA